MKQQRHIAISELLSEVQIHNQDDLRTKLAARGFHVTQATLSRDIRELQLVKGSAGYVQPASGYAESSEAPGIRQVLQSFTFEVRQAFNLLVLVTATGSAQPVAASIDYEDWPEIVGTIAGDDAVLIICADEKQGSLVKVRIESFIDV